MASEARLLPRVVDPTGLEGEAPRPEDYGFDGSSATTREGVAWYGAYAEWAGEQTWSQPGAGSGGQDWLDRWFESGGDPIAEWGSSVIRRYVSDERLANAGAWELTGYTTAAVTVAVAGGYGLAALYGSAGIMIAVPSGYTGGAVVMSGGAAALAAPAITWTPVLISGQLMAGTVVIIGGGTVYMAAPDPPPFRGRHSLRRHNDQLTRVSRELGGLTQKQHQQLHRVVSKGRYTYEEILDIARQMFR